MESLSKSYEKEKIELQQLRVPMVYQENAIKDAKAKSTILKKRLRETEDDLQRVNKLFDQSLAARRDLQEKVNDLKQDLILTGAGSPKSNSK